MKLFGKKEVTTMKLFGVYHEWDTDGGFGDAVGQKDLIGVTNSEEEAKAYVEKWSNDHIYDKPYDYLHCGLLIYEELPMLGSIDEEPDIYPYEWMREAEV